MARTGMSATDASKIIADEAAKGIDGADGPLKVAAAKELAVIRKRRTSDSASPARGALSEQKGTRHSSRAVVFSLRLGWLQKSGSAHFFVIKAFGSTGVLECYHFAAFYLWRALPENARQRCFAAGMHRLLR